MRTQPQRSQFNLSVKSMLILSIIILFSCSHRLLAQQKDGDGTNVPATESNTEPSRPTVNLNYLFSNLTLLNGEYLEMFGAGSSRGIVRGHPTVGGAEFGTTTAHPLIFSTNGVERMRITPDGALLYGTTVQGAPFEFYTPSAVLYSPTSTQAARMRLINSSPTLNSAVEINLGGHDSTGVPSSRVRLVSISTNNTPAQTSGDFAIGLRSLGTLFESARFLSNGRVGIGTSAPTQKLDVQGGAINASGGLCMNGDCKTSWAQVGGGGGSQWTTSGANIFYNTGNVGIGTASPTSKLHVAGDARVTGNLTVDGNIAAKYQDVAEWVPAAEQLDAGTVVVLDTTKSNQVTYSNKSYDTRVAGVVSAQPGITLGEKSDDKVLVATTGRVYVNVDATSGPIEIGDLLVTSDREGFAMKSAAVEIGGVRIHRPGTLIGKALEPLRSGAGKILVLLSLQ